MGIADKLFQMKKEKAEANLKAGEAFLENNKNKDGVVTLPSGLQYEVITMGDGPKPTAYNKVTCHYHGTLIDGTVFDSSVKRGQPASFPLNMVIKGWTEGLQLMPTGSKWRFFIPPHLGYGDRQVSAEIGPNSTLIFEVELLGIN
jgi:FKBP-type peptidyl-prolyl cis-trans isomerase FklB